MNFEWMKWLFFAPVLAVGTAAAWHATGYLHGDGWNRRRWFWFYFVGTLLSMSAVVWVDSMFGFILAWESMGLFSSGLVGFESKEKATMRAVWIYLLACHAGAVFLLFAGVLSLRPDTSPMLLFFLLLGGFALKIGFPPFHVWLPEAHPAAPAPASAVMSGAMIPLGFYGLWRWSPSSAYTEPAAGITFLSLGVVAALGGILFALPQRNIKKLLAFSSVENMGVISMAVGLALLGGIQADEGARPWVNVAWCAAGLHLLNHALLKGGLFLGAGSVLRMTGTLDMDCLGGLMKKMPWTGSLFTLNAFGLSGLPPMNAFLGEFLLYAAAIAFLAKGVCVIPATIVLVSLALTGGIAAAVYTKVVSAVFLGEPRSDLSQVRETPKRMIFAQMVLFVLSLGISVAVCVWFLRLLDWPAIVFTLLFFIALVLGLLFLRALLPKGRVHPRQLTWDCGYEKPTSRMAWTGTAFAQPLADTFNAVLHQRTHVREDKTLFPRDLAIATETDDAGISRLFGPLFHFVARLFHQIHVIQNGSLHFYILLMILALIALLIWGALV